MRLVLLQLGPRCQGSRRRCLNGTCREEINASTQLRCGVFIPQGQTMPASSPHRAGSSKGAGKRNNFCGISTPVFRTHPPQGSVTLWKGGGIKHREKKLKWKTGLAENGWQMPAVRKMKGRLQSWMCCISERLRGEEKKAARHPAPDLPATENFSSSPQRSKQNYLPWLLLPPGRSLGWNKKIYNKIQGLENFAVIKNPVAGCLVFSIHLVYVSCLFLSSFENVNLLTWVMSPTPFKKKERVLVEPCCSPGPSLQPPGYCAIEN